MSVASSSLTRRHRWQDRCFSFLTGASATVTLLALAGIVISLWVSAWPALKTFGPAFFWTAEWDVVGEQFGGLIAIFGTVVSAGIALLVAVPLSFGIAVFLTQTCPPRWRQGLSTAVELLAAVPSIIYGMFGLFVFAPWFASTVQPLLAQTLGTLPVIGIVFTGAFNGLGVLAAGLILAMMVLPFIASVMRDVFDIVPPVLKESAYGLGCTTWEVVTRVVLPYSKAGVVGGIMLGLGRALGETMAVTFVIGNAHKLSPSLFSPGNSIASTLANEFGEAEPGLHYASLFALGLALFLITLLVLSLSKWLLARAQARQGLPS